MLKHSWPAITIRESSQPLLARREHLDQMSNIALGSLEDMQRCWGTCPKRNDGKPACNEALGKQPETQR